MTGNDILVGSCASNCLSIFSAASYFLCWMRIPTFGDCIPSCHFLFLNRIEYRRTNLNHWQTWQSSSPSCKPLLCTGFMFFYCIQQVFCFILVLKHRRWMRIQASVPIAISIMDYRHRSNARSFWPAAHNQLHRLVYSSVLVPEMDPRVVSSGGGTKTILSNRPGLLKAESRFQGVLVAPMISTPSLLLSVPSSSCWNWLIKWRPADCFISLLLAPRASISSMNKIQGVL